MYRSLLANNKSKYNALTHKLSNNFILRSLSTAPLLKEEHSCPQNERVTVKPETVKVNNDKVVTKITQHPAYNKIINSVTTSSTRVRTQLTLFARGPLRSNLFVSLELLKLISAEQRLLPALSTWPQAKASYRAAFDSLKVAWDAGKISPQGLKARLEEVTWGDVGRGLRVSAEMAAFYYIGQLTGMIISLPFK